MNKRFGRNQRRKMREQLAASQAEKISMGTELAMRGGALRAASSRIDELEQQLANAKIVIGRNHPSFPAERLELGFMPAPRDRFDVGTGPRDITTMAAMTITANRDVVFNEVHFRLAYGDQVSSAYAVSEHAMRTVPKEILCRAITEEMVHLVIDVYRNVKGGRHG